jgi:uncharacterized alpha/beta hydrolase family protein
MKKMFVSIGIVLLLLIVVASVALASAGQKQMPFKGSLHAVENNEVDWPTIYVHGSGSGTATALGKFTVTYDGVVQNDENGVGTAALTAHFVAANGDSLFADASGIGQPTETPGVNSIVENYTITGGTGRFAGATGSFTVNRLITLATGVTDGTIEGKIVLP